MSHIDDLLDAYQRQIAIPWPESVAHKQRVWMVVYSPDHERRLRRSLPDFEAATKKAGHGWSQFDLDGTFEAWIDNHRYRDEYLAEPSLLRPALGTFMAHLEDQLGAVLEQASDNDVVAIVGVGSLFGLGSEVRASAVLESVASQIKGRVLVFFPGRRDGSNYRLLDAQDGWNYLAVPIEVDGGLG